MVERNFQGLSLISARRLASPESSSAWDHLCPAHAGDTQVRRQADPPSEERDDIKIVSQLFNYNHQQSGGSAFPRKHSIKLKSYILHSYQKKTFNTTSTSMVSSVVDAEDIGADG